MSLQARMSSTDSRLYSVNRDVAHCFGAVVTEVAARLEDGRWPPITAYLKANNVSMDQLGEACEAFILFVRTTADRPKETMADALQRSGWLALPEPAQVAYMAYLGVVMSGIFFHGAREATLGGEGPCSSLHDLQEVGRKAHQLMTTPRWLRPLSRLAMKFKEAGRAFRGMQRN